MSRDSKQSEDRQKAIVEMLEDLHAGKSFDEVKARFEEAFDGVSALEISQAEQALIGKGFPVQELARLCDVHAAVFKGSVLEIHRTLSPWEAPGHPAHTLKEENRALTSFVDSRVVPHLVAFVEARGDTEAVAAEALSADLRDLSGIDTHYVRKEQLFFPYMEQSGIKAPPKVMWAVDDEIRGMIKDILGMVDSWVDPKDTQRAPKKKVQLAIGEMVAKIEDMVYKEEGILLPMVIDTFTDEQWNTIASESQELGYFLIEPPPPWRSLGTQTQEAESVTRGAPDEVALPSGSLTVDELVGLLDTLPMDITFVGKDDRVRYFSQGKERIFARTKAVIGRQVKDCHPPKSVHIVEGILRDFREGRKDQEAFWIKMGDKLVHIRYFAVRDKDGAYLGTLEVTQDIEPLRAIQGEKRLMEE